MKTEHVVYRTFVELGPNSDVKEGKVKATVCNHMLSATARLLQGQRDSLQESRKMNNMSMKTWTAYNVLELCDRVLEDREVSLGEDARQPNPQSTNSCHW